MSAKCNRILLGVFSSSALLYSQCAFAQSDNLYIASFFSDNIARINGKKKKTEKEITPSAMCPNRTQGPFFSVEFLYWHSSEDSLESALSIEGGTQNTSGSVKVKSLEQKFEWNPGCRIGLGYNFPYYGWDGLVQWTYMYTDPSGKFEEGNLGVAAPVIVADSIFLSNGNNSKGPPFADEVKSKWRMIFNSIDLDFGRNFKVSPSLSLRPHGGLKSAWIHQHYRVHGVFVPQGSDQGGNATDFANTFTAFNNFFGVGPYIGTDARWRLPSNVGLFFNLAAAGVIGKFKTQGKYTDFLENDGFGNISALNTFVQIKSNRYRIAPMIQLSLGFDWNKCIGKRRQISLKAGYEIQYWWAQNRFPSSENIILHRSPVGDLMMHGLDLGLRFDF